jgi:two-component system chemotaxis sensor kinase CheA
MQMVFDISEDEIPIFLAEVDEHLQALDEILVQIENLDSESELLQTAFRAAHTLKGMSGMIGHQRMTNLTHAMETAFDGVRKHTLEVSTPLINLCLDAVDSLRVLREEVITGESSEIEVDGLIARFHEFLDSAGTPASTAPAAAAIKPEPAPAQAEPAPAAPAENQALRSVQVRAKIDPKSIASAARAFQLLMTLQNFGEVSDLHPPQEVIETAAPVAEFTAKVSTGESAAEIYGQLTQISEVLEVQVEGYASAAAPAAQPEPPAEKPAKAAESAAAEGKSNGSAPVAAAVAPAAANQPRRNVDMTVRTSVERLDTLMNLVGELITDRNHLFQVRNHLEAEAAGNPEVESLNETVAHISRITDQLQEEVMSIRMLPIGNLFHKFPRMVRDLAQKTGKQIDVVLNGEDTELDRSMIEEINDPLIHLVRNSVDHGVETPEERVAAGKPPRGTITLNAWHEQGRIVLTVSDDGAGIDPENMRRSALKKGLITPEEAALLSDEQAIDLIFMPGFSTAKTITDISGRGVGMDIVHTNIQRVNGTIHIETQKGKGTSIQIVLPLTLAIVPTLLVKVCSSTFAIPLVMVTETLRLSKEEINTIRGKPVTLLRGSVLPLLDMADVFDLDYERQEKNWLFAVVVNSGKQRIGLVVDSFTGEEEVVVKSLGAFIGDLPGISSAAILGDGRIALIVDVPGLLKLAGIHA